MKKRMLLLIAVLLAVWTGCALAEQVVTPGEAIVPPQATMQPENAPANRSRNGTAAAANVRIKVFMMTLLSCW